MGGDGIEVSLLGLHKSSFEPRFSVNWFLNLA